MGCCSCMSKFFLVTFNLVFFLAGIIPLVFGIIALVDEELLEKAINVIPGTEQITDIVDITDLGKNFAVAFIVLGSAIVVIGLFGFCGACCNNRCMLGVYMSLLVLILLGEIALIIIAAGFPDTFNEGGEALLKQGFKNISDCDINSADESLNCGTEAQSLAWHTMQYELKCCGPSGNTDYTDSEIWSRNDQRSSAIAPLTCCQNKGGKLTDADINSFENSECVGNGTVVDDYNQKGCFSALVDWAVKSPIFIGVLAGIGALELILLFATCAMIRKKSDKNNMA